MLYKNASVDWSVSVGVSRVHYFAQYKIQIATIVLV
jgi:hypothetical protein